MYLTKYRYKDKVKGTIIPNINRNRQYNFSKKEGVSYESKRQAFKRASDLLFFNDDMQYFVTLTYKDQHKDYQMVLNDIKNFSRREPDLKYIGVVEKHKTGCLHIHLITNKISTHSLRKGKLSATNWHKGFSDVIHISSFDDNFNIMKYLFKYLRKSDKVGGRWVLKSRNLNRPIKTNRQMDINETVKYLQFLDHNGYEVEKVDIKDHTDSKRLIFRFKNKSLDS